LQRGPNQPVGSLREDRPAHRNCHQRRAEQKSEDGEADGSHQKLGEGRTQARRQPGFDDGTPAIEQRPGPRPDQRRRHEDGQGDSPKPERGITRATFCLDPPHPNLRQLKQRRHRAHRLLGRLPYLHRHFHAGHQNRAGSRRGIGWLLRGLRPFGGEVGDQAFDLVGRYRGRQLQHDGRAGGFGRPAGQHRAEQKQ